MHFQGVSEKFIHKLMLFNAAYIVAIISNSIDQSSNFQHIVPIVVTVTPHANLTFGLRK
jgi:hypothetical protein